MTTILSSMPSETSKSTPVETNNDNDNNNNDNDKQENVQKNQSSKAITKTSSLPRASSVPIDMDGHPHVYVRTPSLGLESPNSKKPAAPTVRQSSPARKSSHGSSSICSSPSSPLSSSTSSASSPSSPPDLKGKQQTQEETTSTTKSSTESTNEKEKEREKERKKKKVKPNKIHDLPANPKAWKPSQLAIYLSHALRLSPKEVVDAITDYILSDKIDGQKYFALQECDLEDTDLNLQALVLLFKSRERLSRECMRHGIWVLEEDVDKNPPRLAFIPSFDLFDLKCEDSSTIASTNTDEPGSPVRPITPIYTTSPPKSNDPNNASFSSLNTSSASIKHPNLSMSQGHVKGIAKKFDNEDSFTLQVTPERQQSVNNPLLSPLRYSLNGANNILNNSLNGSRSGAVSPSGLSPGAPLRPPTPNVQTLSWENIDPVTPVNERGERIPPSPESRLLNQQRQDQDCISSNENDKDNNNKPHFSDLPILSLSTYDSQLNLRENYQQLENLDQTQKTQNHVSSGPLGLVDEPVNNNNHNNNLNDKEMQTISKDRLTDLESKIAELENKVERLSQAGSIGSATINSPYLNQTSPRPDQHQLHQTAIHNEQLVRWMSQQKCNSCDPNSPIQPWSSPSLQGNINDTNINDTNNNKNRPSSASSTPDVSTWFGLGTYVVMASIGVAVVVGEAIFGRVTSTTRR